MAEVASAFVSLVPSARGFGSKLESQVGGEVKGSGKRLGSTFGRTFALAGGVLAAAGVGSLLKGSISEAREAQKVGAQTNAVIKSTGGAANVTAGQVGKLSTALSNKAGIDDEVIQAGQNMLLTFKNVRNEAGKGNDIFSQASSTLVDLSVAMGTQPKQAAIQLGKALNDPVKGISALTRVGVSFTAGQKNQIKQLVSTGRTMDAQKIILKELNSEFGGSAAAQATAADKARVAWGNLKEQIGTALLPVVDSLAKFATNTLIPALSKTVTFVDQNKASVGILASGIATAVLAMKAYNIVSAIMAARSAAQAVAAGTATEAQIALNTAMRANVIGLIITALFAAAAAFVYLWKHSVKFREIVKGVLKVVANVFLGFAGFLIHTAAKAFGWVPGLGPKLKSAAKHFDEFRDHVNNALNGIHKYVNISTKVTGPLASKVAAMNLAGARAAGGSTMGGKAYLVGENGPEIWTDNRSGRIIPNNKLHATAIAAGASGGAALPDYMNLVVDDMAFGAYVDARIDDRLASRR